jgi:hypothetical protein
VAPLWFAQVERFFRFLIQDEALGDVGRTAGDVASCHRCHRLPRGVPARWVLAYKTHNAAGQSSANEIGDQITEAVVILTGTRIPSIVDPLDVGASDTGGAAVRVRMAVSDCLVTLVALMDEDRSGQLIDALFKTRHAVRRAQVCCAARCGVWFGGHDQGVQRRDWAIAWTRRGSSSAKAWPCLRSRCGCRRRLDGHFTCAKLSEKRKRKK